MLIEDLIIRMACFNRGEPKLTQHLIKVYEFAHVIGVKEGLDEETLRILDIASVLHDIGIRPAMERYGRCDGKIQEEVGPAYARELLREADPDRELSPAGIDRICYLIAHHHTYEHVEGDDYRILLEADFLVNAFEGDSSRESILKFREEVFRTETGKELLDQMFTK